MKTKFCSLFHIVLWQTHIINKKDILMNEKIENQLNLAMEISPQDLKKSQDLSVGFDEETDTWDLIVRYQSLEQTRQIPEIRIHELLNGYAVLNVPAEYVEQVAALPEIIFVEKPKRLEFAVTEGRRVSCIPQVQVQNFEGESANDSGLFGKGVIVGIVDSGIDYTHSAFRNQDGTTRILKLWDQMADRVYDEAEINEALMTANPYELVNSIDSSGHGTHVAGIAAGNYAENKNDNLGIATQSSLIIVKMANTASGSFPQTTRLMEGVDFIIRQATAYQMPLSLNISFGNSYGSHDGTSLLSSYLDSVIDGNQVSVQIGVGNEGDSAGHTGGYVREGVIGEIELQVSNYQQAFSVQLWKNFSDIFELQIISPSGKNTVFFNENSRIWKFRLDHTDISVLYGTPKPFSRFQEIYMELIPQNAYVDAGIWIIRILPKRIVVGRYDFWLPGTVAVNVNTKFLSPDPDTSLTIPGTTLKAVSVGAYDSSTDVIATFSGRGYLRENNAVKPDLVAPGVNVISASAGGGLEVRSGTSMATPFVTGSAALLMEWGIVRGNDPFLYGEKIKAYLIRGARRLPTMQSVPTPSAGWGALCLSSSLPE